MNHFKHIFLGAIMLLSLPVFSQSKLQKAVNDSIVKKLKPKLETDFKNYNLNLGNPIFIRIFKKAPEYEYGVLEIWVQGNEVDTFSLVKEYPICYYSGGLGTKKKQGDGKTPEGFYYVNKHRINQNSSYHRAFNIGYPNSYDKSKNYTGSYIMIHGACCSIGCIAMTDSYIEEIWTIGILALANGQDFFRVHIFPFHMTKYYMNRYKENENFNFWQNLKEGYDFFETHHYPPNVEVKSKYIFSE